MFQIGTTPRGKIVLMSADQETSFWFEPWQAERAAAVLQIALKQQPMLGVVHTELEAGDDNVMVYEAAVEDTVLFIDMMLYAAASAQNRIH